MPVPTPRPTMQPVNAYVLAATLTARQIGQFSLAITLIYMAQSKAVGSSPRILHYDPRNPTRQASG